MSGNSSNDRIFLYEKEAAPEIEIAQETQAEKRLPRIYALGHVTKDGLSYLIKEGEMVKPGKIPINKKEEKEEKGGRLNLRELISFVRDMTPDDQIYSPYGQVWLIDGKAYNYIKNNFDGETLAVFNIHSTTLQKFMEELGYKKPEECILHLSEKPEFFYSFTERDCFISILREKTLKWIESSERRKAASNSLMAFLWREEIDNLFINPPDKKGWVNKRVKEKVAKESRRVTRETGIKLDAEVKEKMEKFLLDKYGKKFERIFEEHSPSTYVDESLADKIAEMEVEIQEKEAEKEVTEFLEDSPLYQEVFKPIPGVGIGTAAKLSTFLLSPLRFPSIGNVRSYADLTSNEGASRKRMRKNKEEENGEEKEASAKGSPRLKSYLLGAFAVNSIKHEGDWRELYLLSKHHQTLRYWGLMNLCEDIRKVMVRKRKGRKGEEVPEEKVQEWSSKLFELRHLPVISHNKSHLKEVLSLKDNSDWGVIKRMLENKTHPIDMFPARIHKQALRTIGITLLDCVYYNWLSFYNQPVSEYLLKDRDYLYRLKFLGKTLEDVKNQYELSVVFEYFTKRIEKLSQGFEEKVLSEIKSKIYKVKEENGENGENQE